MKAVVAVLGPNDAGPGERQEMLARAHDVLSQAGVTEPVRIDVPARGTAGVEEGSALREGVEAIIPALQSGSLFGGRSGVLVVDAHQLSAAESAVAADLVRSIDPDATTVVFVAAGSLPAGLAAAVRAAGETLRVKKYRERDAASWLAGAARERRVRIHGDAVAALVQRFGSDVAALGQALDQLAAAGDEITAELVLERFANRPDVPVWHYGDAIADGDVATALRRLSDFLTHGHPLQLLAFLSGEVRKRSLAATAPDIAAFAAEIGAGADTYPVRKAWDRRMDSSDEELRRAVGALARADVQLKSAPEATHRVTMERLTVALCRWMGGRRSR